MTMARPIVYEPHPVSPERKAELIGKGFKIIDAVFKPSAAPVAAAKRAKAVPVGAPGAAPAPAPGTNTEEA